MVCAKTLVTTYKGTQHQSPEDHNQIIETVDGPYVIQECQALARRTYILKETFCLSLSENYASPVQQTGWNVLYTSVFFCFLTQKPPLVMCVLHLQCSMSPKTCIIHYERV
jgi:hypothetical protein